jgi:hypothetical protein
LGILLNNPTQYNTRKPLYARSGWEIPTEEPLSTLQHKMDYEADTFKKNYGVKIRSRSIEGYNCVGMVFAFRRAIIMPEHLERILHEDGYHLISQSEIFVGDIVVYSIIDNQTQKRELAHVGLIYQIDRLSISSDVPVVTVLSKWGQGPECFHDLRRVPPTFGQPTGFYTERVP